jgi:uncharacterized membrane protein
MKTSLSPSLVSEYDSVTQPASLQPAITLFAIGLLGLGVLALIYGDFALVWQPVAPWVPGRTILAYASGVLMLVCGIGLLFPPTVQWAVRILFPYLVIWTLLKVPALVVAPQIEGVWLGFGELTLMLSGGWILFARLSGINLGFATGDTGLRAAKILFGLSLLPIGLSHLIYVKETASFVPAWLPYREGLTVITGVGQIAAGLGVLFSVLPQIAATAEAIMISLFTLLCWAPAIAATPRVRMPWTAFFISWTFGSAAWVVAQSILRDPVFAPSRNSEPHATAGAFRKSSARTR